MAREETHAPWTASQPVADVGSLSNLQLKRKNCECRNDQKRASENQSVLASSWQSLYGVGARGSTGRQERSGGPMNGGESCNLGRHREPLACSEVDGLLQPTHGIKLETNTKLSNFLRQFFAPGVTHSELFEVQRRWWETLCVCLRPTEGMQSYSALARQFNCLTWLHNGQGVST
jgi:hypothetical protein